MSDLQIPVVFAKVIDYAASLGVVAINTLPGAWVQEVDDNWTIAVNGHLEDTEVEPRGCMMATLKPMDLAVWWNGWLAALVSVDGRGAFASGSLANEDSFIAALDQKMAGEVNHDDQTNDGLP